MFCPLPVRLGFAWRRLCIILPRNWFKGADTVSILLFLEHTLQDKLDTFTDEDTKKLFELCLVATSSANKFMKTLYNAGFWLSFSERQDLISHGHRLLNAFNSCADLCYWADLTRFKLQPKQHMFGELMFEIEFHHRHKWPTPNPLAYSTQMDEDFVGRICVFSRKVSICSIHSRTLSRYQIALRALL